MKANLATLGLIKHVLSANGQKIEDDKGNETFAPRLLNGEESAQRRHFNKVYKPIMEEFQKEAKVFVDANNENVKVVKEDLKKSNPKKKSEEDKDYEARIVVLLNKDEDLIAKVKEANEKMTEIQKKEYDFELETKTLEVVKKYYKEYGEKVGWLEGDDESVECVEKLLGL